MDQQSQPTGSLPSPCWESPYLFALLVSGLVVRLLLTPFGVFTGDAQAYRVWASRLVTSPLSSFYAEAGDGRGGFRGAGTAIDHLPGDVWFLWLIANVYHWFSPDMDLQSFGFLFLLKLVPSLADVGIGLLLFLIARRVASPRAGLLAAALFLFNPAPIFLSVTWGQWDSLSAGAMLLALWLLLRGNPQWALPALTYACLIKPQLAVLLPLVLLAWWRWHVRPISGARTHTMRHVGRILAAALASLGVLLAVALPFSVGLPLMQTRWTIFERASLAFDRYPILSANAFNLWGIVAHDDLIIDDRQAALFGLSHQQWGMLLLVVALLTALTLFWHRPSATMALWSALASTLALFMLPTRMHERYLLPAVVLAVLLAALAPELRWLAAALSLTYLANLVVVYAMAEHRRLGAGGHPNEWAVLGISAVNLLLLIATYVVGVAWARPTAIRQFGNSAIRLVDRSRTARSTPTSR